MYLNIPLLLSFSSLSCTVGILCDDVFVGVGERRASITERFWMQVHTELCLEGVILRTERMSCRSVLKTTPLMMKAELQNQSFLIIIIIIICSMKAPKNLTNVGTKLKYRIIDSGEVFLHKNQPKYNVYLQNDELC